MGAEGLYTIAIHYCNKSPYAPGSITVDLWVVEMNPGPEYLGAGLAPVSRVYFWMTGIFALMGAAWGYVLWKSRTSSKLYKVK